MRVRHIVICGLSGFTIFSKLSHKMVRFKKIFLNVKWVFLFSLQISPETSLIFWGILRNTGWSKSLCATDDYNPQIIADLKMVITEYIRSVDRTVLNTVF